MSFTNGKTILEEAIEKQAEACESAMASMEPEAAWTGDIGIIAQVSLAISMKRIADLITNPTLVDAPMILAYPAIKVDPK